MATRTNGVRAAGDGAGRPPGLTDYEIIDPGVLEDGPDVQVDLPAVKAEELDLALGKLDAHLALKAKVLDLVHVEVGVDARAEELRLGTKGLEVQALVRGRLDRIAGMIGDAGRGGSSSTAGAVARRLGAAARHAAARRVEEIGEKRRQRRAEKHDATPMAVELADDLGVDLDAVVGSGAEGRITVRDVREAATE